MEVYGKTNPDHCVGVGHAIEVGVVVRVRVGNIIEIGVEVRV